MPEVKISLLPQGATLSEEIDLQEKYLEATKTYKIDFESGRVVGFCDDIEALKQAIYLILNIERYEYLIYSDNYGSELKGVIGKDRYIAESEYKRRIKEALIQDYRVDNVDNFIFYYDKDGLTVVFTIFSIYGEFEFTKEVL